MPCFPVKAAENDVCEVCSRHQDLSRHKLMFSRTCYERTNLQASGQFCLGSRRLEGGLAGAGGLAAYGSAL